MTNLTPWFNILLALSAYFAAAVLASAVVRKIGGDLKSMAGRSSPRILLIGAAANLGVLMIVLLLLTQVAGLPISALGVDFDGTSKNALVDRDCGYCVEWACPRSFCTTSRRS